MKNDRNSKNVLDNQKGFTLVEIIAVLVILGILAAVAIPKYFNLQEQAKDKALAAALGEGIGRVNQYFAKQLLLGDTPGAIAYNDGTIGTNLGDFTLATTVSGNTISLLVTGKAGTPLAGNTLSKSVPRPGSP